MELPGYLDVKLPGYSDVELPGYFDVELPGYFANIVKKLIFKQIRSNFDQIINQETIFKTSGVFAGEFPQVIEDNSKNRLKVPIPNENVKLIVKKS